MDGGFCTSAPWGMYNGLGLAVRATRTLPISLPNMLLFFDINEERDVDPLNILGAGRIIIEPLVSSSGIWYMLLRLTGFRFSLTSRYVTIARATSNGTPTPHATPTSSPVEEEPSPEAGAPLAFDVEPATPDAMAGPTKACICAGRRTSEVSLDNVKALEASSQSSLFKPHTNVLVLTPELHGVIAISPSVLTVERIRQS